MTSQDWSKDAPSTQWFSGSFSGMWFIIIVCILVFSVYLQIRWKLRLRHPWKHLLRSKLSWCSLAFLIWLLLYGVECFLEAQVPRTYNGTLTHRAIVELMHFLDLLMFTSAAAYLSYLIADLPRRIPDAVLQWMYVVVIVAWFAWEVLLVILYSQCQDVPNAYLPCIQSKPHHDNTTPQIGTFIRGVVWVCISIGLGIFGADYICATRHIQSQESEQNHPSHIRWTIASGTLVVTCAAFRGIMWIVLSAHSFNSSLPDLSMSPALYILVVRLGPSLLSAIVFAVWFRPVQFNITRGEAFLEHAVEPLLTGSFAENMPGEAMSMSMHTIQHGTMDYGAPSGSWARGSAPTSCSPTVALRQRWHHSAPGLVSESASVHPSALDLDDIRNLRLFPQVTTSVHPNRVVEELWASAFARTVVSKWQNIAVPAAEELYARFQTQALRARDVKFGSGSVKFGSSSTIDTHAFHSQNRILGLMDDAGKEFEEHIEMLRSAQRFFSRLYMDTHHDEIVKPSTAKADKLLHCMAVNLMVYTAKHSFRRDYWTITVGAPAAHSLGFKKGGAWRLHMSLTAKQKVLDRYVAAAEESTALFPAAHRFELSEEHFEMAAEIEVLKLDLRRRLDVCLPQGMAAALAAVWENIQRLSTDEDYQTLEHCGMLLSISSLLSTQGKEMGMLEDFLYTVSILGDCKIGFNSFSSSTSSRPRGDSRDASRHILWVDERSVILGVPLEEPWAVRLLQSFPPGTWMALVPVLFTCGVNEMQTVANAFGDTTLEKQVNLKAIRRLRTYCHSVRQTTDAEERILDEVQDLILQGLSKQIKILTLSAQITRAFRGGHWISCKSAKDRTSMLCTLEASQAILPDWHIGWNTMLIDESHMEFANMLRGQEGVRLSNCESNTGKRAYAFNALQLKTLPKEMRPPKATCGTNES